MPEKDHLYKFYLRGSFQKTYLAEILVAGNFRGHCIYDASYGLLDYVLNQTAQVLHVNPGHDLFSRAQGTTNTKFERQPNGLDHSTSQSHNNTSSEDGLEWVTESVNETASSQVVLN